MLKQEFSKAKNISIKQIMILLGVALLLIAISLFSSGILKSSVPYKNIISTEKPIELASSEVWGLYTVEKKGMLPYFAFKGKNSEPKESIHVRIVFFDNKNEQDKKE